MWLVKLSKLFGPGTTCSTIHSFHWNSSGVKVSPSGSRMVSLGGRRRIYHILVVAAAAAAAGGDLVPACLVLFLAVAVDALRELGRL